LVHALALIGRGVGDLGLWLVGEWVCVEDLAGCELVGPHQGEARGLHWHFG
jgi:hypothetical protein